MSILDSNDHAYIVAEDWYNRKSKTEVLVWCTKHGLDIGQNRLQLDSDWNERVIEAYANFVETKS